MSLIDKYAEYMCRKAGSGNGVVRRVVDPNYQTPHVFYAMDEIKGRQVLHRFDKSSGAPEYTGTFQVLYKTEDMEKFCLIMRRIRDMWRVPEAYRGSYESERGIYVVAQYYPGTESRIYLKGLGERALQRVVAKYERRFQKRLPPANTIHMAGTSRDGDRSDDNQ